ncbi:MAG: carboxy-S-adenosyl-L-methionine synthase CmoA [Gammaproteobacteria bacterium]|nr:carboxy-S-adenosyl-L-methionine synthase CmoA [Gammaproteobacteria bacterium]
MSSSSRDRIYRTPQPKLVNFSFDNQVAEVFDDMARRSIPGYELILATLADLAPKVVTSGSHVYDLGCALGAATHAIRQGLGKADARLFAVDNSPAMVERCQRHLASWRSPLAVEVRCEDIRSSELSNASLVAMNFTLQFLEPDERLALLERIHAALNPGGVLLLAEKIRIEPAAADQLISDLHLQFKRRNGYSELEISQKRSALEKVMRIDSLSTHQQRLSAAGFSSVVPCIQALNFVALLAFKA